MPRAKAYKPDLDFKRVEKYVRRAPALLLPTGWRDWPKGLPPLKHKLPIDDELAQLPSGRKRILSADEVRARYPEIYWPSHQVAIRLQLLWYVNFEFLDSITADAEVAQFHRRLLSLLESAEAPLLEFLRLINARSTVRFVPPVERDLISNVRSAIEPVEKLKNWVTWCLRETRPFKGGRPVVDWKRQFVLRLAAFWRVMTDSQPGTSDNSPFGRFVSAAWSSLYHDSPETSWDDCIGSYSRSESAEEAIVSVKLAALYVGFVWAGGFPENPPAT